MTPRCDWKEANHLAKPHYQGIAFQCVKCGAISPKKTVRACPVIGVGDRVEQFIKWLFPTVKQCGGCKKRKQVLNDRGPKWQNENSSEG